MIQWNLLKDSETTAFKDFCFWTLIPLIIFIFFGFYSIVLTIHSVLMNEIKILDIDSSFLLPRIIAILTVALLFSIFVPYIAYKLSKTAFNYDLSLFFQSSVAFMQGMMILYIMYTWMNLDRNYPMSKFLWIYAVLFMLLYFVLMNLS